MKSATLQSLVTKGSIDDCSLISIADRRAVEALFSLDSSFECGWEFCNETLEQLLGTNALSNCCDEMLPV